MHVLCTICGQDYVAKTLPMLRSLLWHRSTALTLHIIADRPARRQLAKDFGDGWGSAALEVDYIHAEQHGPVRRPDVHPVGEQGGIG